MLRATDKPNRRPKLHSLKSPGHSNCLFSHTKYSARTSWPRLAWQNMIFEENTRSSYWSQLFRPVQTITECRQNSIGAHTDQSERHLHIAKNPQIPSSLLSALGLICDTFLATHINNVSGKRTRKASSELLLPFPFSILLLLPSPSTIEYHARLGDLCTARPSANPLSHLAT